jgi:transmembrane sensor
MSGPGGEELAAREAAEWLTKLNRRGVSNEMLEAFYRWRREPANAAAFARIEDVWQNAGSLEGDPEIAFAVRDVLAAKAKPRFFWGRRMVLAGGLSAVAAGIAVGLWPRVLDYRTAVGEQRFVTLEDGSRIHLNTDSRIEVAFSGATRRVRLERGEAWFEVEHDAARPFVVGTDDAKVRAIGTSFAVRLYADGTRVVLATGRVEVRDAAGSQTMLAPAQAVRISSGRLGGAESVDIASEAAWRSGHLSFNDIDLANAVSEVNRYSVHRIMLDAPGFATRKVNGLFAIGDEQAFVDAVSALFPLDAVTASDGSRRLRPRAQASS